MDFYFSCCYEHISNLKFEYCSDLNKQECVDNIIYIEKKKHLDYLSRDINGSRILKFGDVLTSGNFSIKFDDQDGMHYSIMISSNLNSIRIKADRLNLLPIYYYLNGTIIYVSSSYSKMISVINNYKVDSLFYPELALLYTPMNGRTHYDCIKRLQFGSEIHISPDGFYVHNHHRFFSIFSPEPVKFKKALQYSTNLYIETIKKYFQDGNAISLTGGFDGRANVACAHYYNIKYSTYSYGRIGNSDVDIPLMISSKLPVDYRPIELDDNYLQSDYLQCILEYLLNTGGQNGFSYPQTLYSIKTISEYSNITITGFIGSELLRSCREPDPEVLSFCVRDALLGISHNNNYANNISNVMTKIGLLEDINLIDDVLDELEYYLKELPKELTVNQKYIVLMYEYIISYVFGPWIYNGMKYSKIRNPFIDHDFFDYVAKTEVSGFYEKFLEQNMIKRRKKLMIYGKIMNKTWPALGKLPMSKGYSPSEVLYPFGLGVLVGKYLRSRKKEAYGLDKLNTVSGAKKYINDMNQNLIKNQSIDIDLVKSMLDKDAYCRDIAFWALSKITYKMIQNTK